MAKSQLSYQEHDSLKECYKASLFKDLYKDRKQLFDSYPQQGKGLSFPEPSMKIGACTYSFKTTETTDKVSQSFDNGKQTLAQRYKKSNKLWDISLTQNICKDFNALVKYEERSSDTQCYVLGGSGSALNNQLRYNAKVNPYVGVFKSSVLYNAPFLSGLKFQADLKGTKLTIQDPRRARFNVGQSYCHPFGLSILQLNNKQDITLTHTMQVNKKFSAGLEFIHNLNQQDPVKQPVNVQVSYDIDNNHVVKQKQNKDQVVQVCVTKKFTDGLSVQQGTVCNIKDPQSFKAMPQFGFKIVSK